MRSLIAQSTVIIVLAAGLAGAQTAAPAAKTTAQPASKPVASTAAVNLPSEATVDSFLKQTFGYQKDLTWKISSIKPAPVPGLAQVDVTLASAQGQQNSRFYVTVDGEHAVVGDIIPFGVRPFDPAKKTLDKGLSGPARGPNLRPRGSEALRPGRAAT